MKLKNNIYNPYHNLIIFINILTGRYKLNFKKSLIFICLIFCLLSITSACASEVNDTVVASEHQNDNLISIENQYNDEISVTENDEILTDSEETFTKLAGKITNDGTELNLTKNYTYSAGDYIVKATLTDDNKYSDTFNETILNVTKWNTSISANDIELHINDTRTIKVTVKPEGLNVTYIPDNSGIVTVENGVVRGIKEGTANITLTVGGDEKYNFNSTTISVTVSKIPTMLTAGGDVRVANDYYAGERGDYYYTVLRYFGGNVLANKTVSIIVAGKTYNRTTDENGRVALQINLKNAGTYTCLARFKGDDVYAASYVLFQLKITKKATKISASNKAFKANAKKTIKVTLKTSKNPYDGKVYLKAGKKVTLKVNGKTYTAKANSKGVAKFTPKLTKKGKYTAKIKFAGDKTYKASSKSIKITVK